MFSKDTIYKARERYLAFIRDWPDRHQKNGKSFKEMFTLNGDLSLWWLSEMQKKDPEASDVFKNLCLYEESGKKGIKPDRSRSLFYYILQRAAFILYIACKIIIFKLFHKRVYHTNRRQLLFMSLFEVTLAPKNGILRDRYYLDLPEDLEKVKGYKSQYVSFYYGPVGKLLKDIKKIKNMNIIFYEQYLNIIDLWNALDIKNLIKYLLLERRKTFRESFKYQGTNAMNLFMKELRTSFVGSGVSEWILLSKAAERIARHNDIACIVSSLENYPYSRALYYGMKRGDPGIKTVAFQHANITPLKLWDVFSPAELSFDGDHIKRMPIPDHFIFQGEMGKRILTQSGYPEERCILAGSPRFDDLAAIKKEPIALNLPSEKKILLVATTYLESDTRAIIRMIFEAEKQLSDHYFVFKAHPNCPVDAIIKEYNLSNYAVSNDNVHQLILRADILITSYSTTADEAIALGCPAICIDTGVIMNMSSFLDIEAAPVIDSAERLVGAVEMMINRDKDYEKYKSNWPRLIEATFYKLDGKGKKRIFDAFENEISLKGRDPQ